MFVWEPGQCSDYDEREAMAQTHVEQQQIFNGCSAKLPKNEWNKNGKLEKFAYLNGVFKSN